jgi:carboxymethylenebutenolidase
MPEVASVTVGGSRMEIYIDTPESGAPWPAVLLTYHREGIDDFTKWIARQYAQAGFFVAVPEIAHRLPADMEPRDRKQHLRDSQLLDDFRATVAYLKTRTDVAKDRLAIAGHCMGGHMLFLAACAMADFRCAVACYPTGMFETWGDTGKTPFEQLSRMQCPVIGFFGGDDKNPSPADADRLDAELARHGVEHAFHRYPGCRHGFQRPTADYPAARAAQADSWPKIYAFLRDKLGAAAAMA